MEFWREDMKQKNRKNKRIILSGVWCAALMLASGCGGTADGHADSAGESVGKENVAEKDAGAEQLDNAAKVFSFTAKDLDGNEVTESIFTEKDLTVLNIWGTFCNPCIREMPELGEWAGEMPDNVQIVGLIIDIGGDEDTEHHDLAVDITQSAGADFRQIIANQDFAGLLKDVIGVPTTMFIDQDGNFAGDPIIGADVDAYKRFVEEYLDGR